MSLWEEYAVVDPDEAMTWLGREQVKLRLFFEVQSGLERTVMYHHGGSGLEQAVPMSFDWTAVRRNLEPDVFLIFGSEGGASHPIYAIVPAQRAVVKLDVHAIAETPGVADADLLSKYLREVEVLMPVVPADRQGEARKHLRSLMRIIGPA
jgi:hypothetical protein